MSTNAHPDPEALLRHEPFVRELAGRLVRDSQAADDIAQQTFLAALQSGTAPTQSVRGWLATIARRVAGRRARSEQRRRARDELAAQPAAPPTPEQIVAREHARTAVVDTVLALPDSYRDVIVLRWFEGLPPRDIARRLHVPVETVRTRHRRAMAQLRERLDHATDGGRAAWCALLTPLALPHELAAHGAAASGAAAANAHPGVLLMSAKLKLGAAIAAVLVVCLTLLWLPDGDAPIAADDPAAAGRPAAAEAATGGAPSAQTANAAAQERDEPSSNDREAAPASATPGSGAVIAHVRWAEDGTPAPGIAVELFNGSQSFAGVSDQDGVARIDGIEPRRYFAVVNRPGHLAGFQKVRVDAGQVLTIDLTVPSGLDLRGVVVDRDGRPIADADVLLAEWSNVVAVVMARTDARGAFAIRDVAVHCLVGARHRDFAPSDMRKMTGSVGGATELRLVLDEPGAALTGVVLDTQERPIAGAAVTIGEVTYEQLSFPDGGKGRDPAPAVAVTDVHGRFALAGLPTGEQALVVDSPRHAPHAETVQLRAGGSDHRTIHLQQGVTVSGRVTMSNGEPASGYVMAAPPEQLVTGGARTRNVSTRGDGSFRITGAAPGKLVLAFRSDDGEARREVVASAGDEVEWNPVLQSGVSLRGRVLDDDGQPVRLMVEATALVDGSIFRRMTGTDEDGTFEVTNIPSGARLRVDLRRGLFLIKSLPNVAPTDEPLVIRVSKASEAHIHGVVLDEHGAPLANAVVRVHSDAQGGGVPQNTDNDTGAFELGPMPAGDYHVRVEATGYAAARTPTRTLRDGETWDLGAIQMSRGGTLRVAYVGDFVDVPEHVVRVHDEAGERAARVTIAAGVGTSPPLLPGRYTLHIGGRGVGIGSRVVPFSIELGKQTQLDVPVQRGVRVPFEFSQAPRSSARLRVTITDAATGALCRRDTAWGTPDLPIAFDVDLAPGTYRVEARSFEGVEPAMRGEREFEVTSTPQRVAVEVNEQ